MQRQEGRTQVSEGEKRVGVSFNPSGKPEVDEVKRLTAQLIEIGLQQDNRAGHVAATRYEEACMWLVKALTNP
jgi:hypothetical protein